MFKVGDRVVVVKNLLGGANTFVGQRGVVNELSDEHFGVGVRTESYGVASFFPEELELIDMHSGHKFRVGDRVVVVGIPSENGKRGEVVRNDVKTWPIEVRFDGDGGSGLLREDELEFEETYDAMSAPHPDEDSLFSQEVDTRHDDAVSHPSHYTSHPSGVECIDITKHMGFLDGNAMKYLWRFSLKNGVEDLYKCRQYLDWLIEAEESKRD